MKSKNICKYIATAYISKEENDFKDCLTAHPIDTIIETGFDWLIMTQKIAVLD
jgi:hypothetical protein